MSEDGTRLRIVVIEGRGIPVRGNDIDTDQIMPTRYLKWITFKGIDRHVFEDARGRDGDKGFLHPFDDPRYAGARILLVNRNFGCGSSREHAPQALHRHGIAAVIGESFGEIFAGNCVSIGMPCVRAASDVVAGLQCLCEQDAQATIVVDLENRIVAAAGRRHPVEISEGARRQFLEGSWDPTAALLAAGEAIDGKIRALPYGW